MQMSSKKKAITVVITSIAIAIGSAGAGHAHRSAHGDHAAKDAVITSVLGIDAATLKSRLKAGETLAAIAGTKKQALIDALVAEKTKDIDAAVTAGKLTAAQATTKKANLVAHVTAEVESVHAPKGKGGRHGGLKHGDKSSIKTPTGSAA
jgi:hypothetical protein